jgi:hypothetical protein
MSGRINRNIRKVKRNIRENITRINLKNIAKGTKNAAVSAKNAAVSAKNAAVSAKDSTVSSIKKTYFGKYEDEYLNTNKRDTKKDDIAGSAWINVYDVSESEKDKLDEIKKMKDSVGTDKDKINPIIHINDSEVKKDIEKEIEDIEKEIEDIEKEIEDIEVNDIFDESFTDNVNKKDELVKKKDELDKKIPEILEQKKAELLEQLITHIKEKKYTEKAGIRNVKKNVIPYSNIDENDFSVKNLKDELLNKFKNLDKVYIEIKENGILNYYISTPIKNYLRYAIVKRGKIKDDKKKEDDSAKKEKQNKLDAKKSEAKELLNSIGTDILGDNKIDAFPPCSKLADAYCYIHPFNVILYERNIMYGLKWELARFNPEENDLYESIERFFKKKNDVPSFNVISEKFKEVYNSTQETKPEAQEGGKQIGGSKEVIDLTDLEEVRGIVYDAKYLDEFKLEKFYYKHYDAENYLYYICKNSILDYRYNHKTWNKEKYYNDNSVDKSGLESNLNEIKNLNEKLTSTLESLREKARENGEINKNKEEERQDRSDERFNDNAGKFGYYTTQLFVHTAKYIQDTFLAGIKTLFIASWNNVITGFLILLFIILVIIMGVALGNGEGGGENNGPNKKPKEENKDFISLLKSMPANINSAYADFNNFATDFGNMVTNGRRAVNDFADAMTGDNTPEDSVRDTYYKEHGRGGDNIIHFNNGDDVVSAYKPIAKIIPKQNGINSNGKIGEIEFSLKPVKNADGQLYELDCTTDTEISKYFTNSCKLRKDYSLDTRFIKDPKSDYEQIKIND